MRLREAPMKLSQTAREDSNLIRWSFEIDFFDLELSLSSYFSNKLVLINNQLTSPIELLLIFHKCLIVIKKPIFDIFLFFQIKLEIEFFYYSNVVRSSQIWVSRSSVWVELSSMESFTRSRPCRISSLEYVSQVGIEFTMVSAQFGSNLHTQRKFLPGSTRLCFEMG